VQGEYFGLGASSVNPPFATSGIAGPELANTDFTPITLSWTLGRGWFTALGVTFVAPAPRLSRGLFISEPHAARGLVLLAGAFMVDPLAPI